MTKPTRTERDRLRMLDDHRLIAEDVSRLVAAAEAKDDLRRAAGIRDVEVARP